MFKWTIFLAHMSIFLIIYEMQLQKNHNLVREQILGLVILTRKPTRHMKKSKWRFSFFDKVVLKCNLSNHCQGNNTSKMLSAPKLGWKYYMNTLQNSHWYKPNSNEVSIKQRHIWIFLSFTITIPCFSSFFTIIIIIEIFIHVYNQTSSYLFPFLLLTLHILSNMQPSQPRVFFIF